MRSSSSSRTHPRYAPPIASRSRPTTRVAVSHDARQGRAMSPGRGLRSLSLRAELHRGHSLPGHPCRRTHAPSHAVPDETTDVPSRGRGRSEPKVLRVGLGRRHRQLPVSFFVLSLRCYFVTAGGAGALIADAFGGVGGDDEAPGTDDRSPSVVERTRLRVHARGLPR